MSAPDRRNSYSVNSYHLVCAGLYDLIQTPLLLDYAQDIIGPDIVCWGMHLFAKMPGDGMEVPLHQDAIYWPLTPARSVTVWLAVDDTDTDNAAMEFVPGSHVLGPLPHEDKALDGSRVLKRAAVDPDQYGLASPTCCGPAKCHCTPICCCTGRGPTSRAGGGPDSRSATRQPKSLPFRARNGSSRRRCTAGEQSPAHWPNCRRPDGEHPELMAAISGGFDGLPPDAGLTALTRRGRSSSETTSTPAARGCGVVTPSPSRRVRENVPS